MTTKPNNPKGRHTMNKAYTIQINNGLEGVYSSVPKVVARLDKVMKHYGAKGMVDMERFTNSVRSELNHSHHFSIALGHRDITLLVVMHYVNG